MIRNKNRITKVNKFQVVLFSKGNPIITFERLPSSVSKSSSSTSIINLFHQIVEECKEESVEWNTISIQYGKKGISFNNKKKSNY